ncbi:alpha/beta hydrolase [Actinocorallia aurea]
MPTAISRDGTPVAYERDGSGPALILVDGAMCHRAGGPMRPLAALLRASFTVLAYDRRGRGESGDTAPYSPEREVEDLRALIAEAGGPVHLYGMSSGAALCLAAAAADPCVLSAALYEPPFLGALADDAAAERAARSRAYTAALETALAEGRRGDAVALFLAHVGTPSGQVSAMRTQPFWPAMEALSPTLAYDDALLGDGTVQPSWISTVTAPLLVLAGSASPPDLREAASVTARSLPTATLRTLPDQTHDVSPTALAPALTSFFTDHQPSPPTPRHAHPG